MPMKPCTAAHTVAVAQSRVALSGRHAKRIAARIPNMPPSRYRHALQPSSAQCAGMHKHAAPGFHLFSSNRLDYLAEQLCLSLAQPADPDSLEPEIILIPQPTLRRWLQRELAQRLGVAAHLEFPTPSEFVWRLLRAQWPDLPIDSPWDQARLRWRLFAELAREEAPQAVRTHLQRAGGDPALARWRLAESLASAFDRYQAYRRMWLEAWEAGADAQDWQAELWRRLQSSGTHSRSQLIGDWLRLHAQATAAPPGLPRRLHAFGTIHVSPDVLHLLAVCARHCQLEFHRPSPCAEYWGDVESLRQRLRREGPDALPDAIAESQFDNPLLQAWGAAGRDFVAQLFSYELVQPQRELDGFVEPERDSLLHAVQADVLERRAPQAMATLREDDLSIQVHACHSRLREVEVLHDRLRDFFDAGTDQFDPPLKPDQVAVLAPNIGDYLPLVRAVFGGIPAQDRRYIPFSLSDRPQAQAHPLVALFLSLLDLPASRRTASELRDLMAVPAVMAALDVQDSDLQRFDDWFAASGIRWGDDEAMRERLGFGRWREHSFAFGVDRLLMGYASGDSDEDIAGIAPSTELEGADAERLDRLIGLLKRMRQLDAWMRRNHTASEWQAGLVGQFIGLLPAVPQDEGEAQARRIVLEALDGFARDAAGAGELPLSVVASAVRETLEAPSPHQPFLGGGVTFAGMVPLRTVPFRVICLLGMDADAFPRREPGGDINRLVDEIRQGRRRLGDRSVREDDRFLFLQLLTAASDRFYVSYGGRDARDGSLREPSPVVAELLDTAQRYLPAGDARTRLLMEHPLQPFSALAFGVGDGRRFSYADQWWLPQREAVLRPVPAFVDASRTDPAVDGLPSLQELIQFLRHPARAFLRDVTGLSLPRRQDERQGDREPLGEDALFRHRVINELIQHERETGQLRARGLLPPGVEGEYAAAAARGIAQPLREARDAWLSDAPAERIEQVLDLSQGRFTIQIASVHGPRRAHVLAGSLKGKHLLQAWVEHIAWSALRGPEMQTRVFHFDRKSGLQQRDLPSFTREIARARLEDLLSLWRQGQSRPLPFAVDAAWCYVETQREKNDAAAAWSAALRTFDDHQGFGEAGDPWLQLAFRPERVLSPAHADEFIRVALRIFGNAEPAA